MSIYDILEKLEGQYKVATKQWFNLDEKRDMNIVRKETKQLIDKCLIELKEAERELDDYYTNPSGIQEWLQEAIDRLQKERSEIEDREMAKLRLFLKDVFDTYSELISLLGF